MGTFTSSLPDHLLESLAATSKELQTPKNKIIEKALHLYLEHIKRAQYIASYKRASKDNDLLEIAEEGMTDYLKQLKDWDETM